jgi:CheY-like chemotaxis protein
MAAVRTGPKRTDEVTDQSRLRANVFDLTEREPAVDGAAADAYQLAGFPDRNPFSVHRVPSATGPISEEQGCGISAAGNADGSALCNSGQICRLAWATLRRVIAPGKGRRPAFARPTPGPDEARSSTRTIHARTHPGVQRATVLIVDDDLATVDIFAQVLRLEGHDVRTARSAEDGMRAVQESGPDVILVDYNLPAANGAEFLRRLRACKGHRDTPVAVVTGDYSLDDTPGTELHQLGARVAFKPLWVAELVDLTSQLLEGRASMQ